MSIKFWLPIKKKKLDKKMLLVQGKTNSSRSSLLDWDPPVGWGYHEPGGQARCDPASAWLGCFSACFVATTALAFLACVCVGLISSGCVSHHSGSFTGLLAVPGIRSRLSVCPEQSRAEPSHGPVALGLPTWGVPRLKREGASWRWHCQGWNLPLKEVPRRPAAAPWPSWWWSE